MEFASGDEFEGTYRKNGNDYEYMRKDIEGNEVWTSLKKGLTGASLEAYEAAMSAGQTWYEVRDESGDSETEECYWKTDLENGKVSKVKKFKEKEEEPRPPNTPMGEGSMCRWNRSYGSWRSRSMNPRQTVPLSVLDVPVELVAELEPEKVEKINPFSAAAMLEGAVG